jgi:hypothetical protein
LGCLAQQGGSAHRAAPSGTEQWQSETNTAIPHREDE